MQTLTIITIVRHRPFYFFTLCFLFISGCVQESSPQLQHAPESVVYVQVNALNVRQCPSTKCRITGVLHRGENIVVINQQNGWLQVNTKAVNKKGWVSSKYVGPNNPGAVKKTGSLKNKNQSPAMPEEEFAAVEAEAENLTVEEEFAPVDARENTPAVPPRVEEEFAK